MGWGEKKDVEQTCAMASDERGRRDQCRACVRRAGSVSAAMVEGEEIEGQEIPSNMRDGCAMT